MSMVPLRMQMYDPMPLRLGPAIKPPDLPLRVPEPPQHDWSCAQAGDGQARSTQGVTPSVLIDGVLATSPNGIDWTTGDVRFRNMRSPYLSRAELANTIKYVPAQPPEAQSPFDLLGGLTGAIVDQLKAWPKLTDYSLPATISEDLTPELVNMIKYMPPREQSEEQILARARVKEFIQGCAARHLEPAEWFGAPRATP